MGQTGRWNGADIVRIVLSQPQTARFLVRKFYQFLISESSVPPDALLEPLCDSFRKSDYDIAGLVRTMLASRHFYSEHAFRQRIKGPVEYVLGAVRAVYRYYESGLDARALPPQALAGWLGAMGQQLFAPPNVKGWPGGASWLNTATVLERANFAGALALGTLWTGSANAQVLHEMADLPRAYDPARLLEEEQVSRPEDVVRVLLDFYLPGGVRSDAQAKILAFLAEGQPSGSAFAHRVREAVHAILATAEYQLA